MTSFILTLSGCALSALLESPFGHQDTGVLAAPETTDTPAKPSDTEDTTVSDEDTDTDTPAERDTAATDTMEPPEDTGEPKKKETGPVDADSDGYTEEEDCDDTDGDVHPGADEVFDSIDNDCDGDIDLDGQRYEGEADFDSYFPDFDLNDNCAGPSAFTIDLSRSPPLQGEGTCESGYGTVKVTISGTLSGRTASITSESGYGSMSYEGEFTEDLETFTATASGTTTFAGYEVHYDGTVDMTRQ